MGFLHINDERIFYLTLGESGPWVTLINGHSRTLEDFKLLSAKISRLGFRIMVLDNRGCGKTQITKPFTIEDMADDVFRIYAQEGIAESYVIGLSMGGMIAQKMSALHPEKILGLILVSTAPRAIQKPEKISGWPTDEEGLKDKMRNYMAEAFCKKNPLLLHAMALTILKHMASNPAFISNMKLQTQAVENWTNTSQPSPPFPILILHGNEDKIIPVAEAHQLHRLFPTSQIQLFPNIGHLLLAECPNEFFAQIEEFIKK